MQRRTPGPVKREIKCHNRRKQALIKYPRRDRYRSLAPSRSLFSLRGLARAAYVSLAILFRSRVRFACKPQMFSLPSPRPELGAAGGWGGGGRGDVPLRTFAFTGLKCVLRVIVIVRVNVHGYRGAPCALMRG